MFHRHSTIQSVGLAAGPTGTHSDQRGPSRRFMLPILGGRYFARRGGDSGYMIITQCEDHAPRKARAAQLGMRAVLEHDGDDYCLMQLHARDSGSTFFELDQ